MSSQRVRIQLTVLVLFVLASVAAQAQKPQPFSADFASTSANGRKTTGKWFFSPPKMRMDMTTPPEAQGKGSPFGGNVSMIIDGTTKTSYMLMPQAHMYMEIQATGAQDMQGMRNLESLSHGGDLCAGNQGSTCKKVGTETMNGRSCDKWEMTDKNSHKSTVWVDQKLFFPVRVQEYEGTVTDFTNIKEGAQDASLFVVPPGYQKFDASAFGRQK
jgi:outer membrane lipoprotein-sorting protein